jgi:hypothetical protein
MSDFTCWKSAAQKLGITLQMKWYLIWKKQAHIALTPAIVSNTHNLPEQVMDSKKNSISAGKSIIIFHIAHRVFLEIWRELSYMYLWQIKCVDNNRALKTRGGKKLKKRLWAVIWKEWVWVKFFCVRYWMICCIPKK